MLGEINGGEICRDNARREEGGLVRSARERRKTEKEGFKHASLICLTSSK